MKRAQVQREVDEDPTLCERTKLYLGDTKDTPRAQGLWVVDVPRPPNFAKQSANAMLMDLAAKQ